MPNIADKINRLPNEELLTFALTLFCCLSFCVLLSYSFPAQKRGIDYLAQGVFSALLAVPTGAAWQSLKRARMKKTEC